MTATAERTWLQTARRVATQLRVDSIRMTTAAGSGHPTSSMSAADVMAVLVTRHLRIDWSNPSDPANDHFVLSKGHASPLLYAAWKALGIVDDYALMHDYRRFGSVLEGHPLPGLPGVDVATTGSLGQGLPAAVGIALAGATTRPVALPGGGAQRRQRTGRGLGVGGRRQGVTFRPAKPHHDRRRQRAGHAWPDRVRGATSMPTVHGSRPSAGTSARSTGMTRSKSTPRSPRQPRRGAHPWCSR